MRWAAHVLEPLQAGGGIAWENPSLAGYAHSKPVKASVAATKASHFAGRDIVLPLCNGILCPVAL